MMKLFNNVYKDKTVLVTGHSGFKGSWLSYWLKRMGAKVIGYSLKPNTNPNHFDLLQIDITSIFDDIRNKDKLFDVCDKFKPEIIFHLAAQPLVKYSYTHPLETFDTNIMGTINVLEAARNIPSVKVVINVTSDKCYQNKEWIWGYREFDSLGGHDPYSASKACSEIITNSYRMSFFNPIEYSKSHKILIASCRAGNVIGGGDWSEGRIIPDIMKAASEGEKVLIRQPYAIRPWQHVLESLSGYLLVGQKLLEGKSEFADAWNFGPFEKDCVEVISLLKRIKNYWDKIDFKVSDNNGFYEAHILKLDCSKARSMLKWEPIWDLEKTIFKVTQWYRNYYEKNHISTFQDLDEYINDSIKKGAVWTVDNGGIDE